MKRRTQTVTILLDFVVTIIEFSLAFFQKQSTLRKTLYSRLEIIERERVISH